MKKKVQFQVKYFKFFQNKFLHKKLTGRMSNIVIVSQGECLGCNPLKII